MELEKYCMCVWPELGTFKQQACDFGMGKENNRENSIIYLNQVYLTIKESKSLYYADYYILGQVIERLNPPEDISNCFFQDCRVKIYRPRYDTATGTFLGLY